MAIPSDPARFGGYFAALMAGGDVVLCHDPRASGCRGYLEPASGIIALSPDLGFEEKLMIAMHELRHLDQIARGFVPSLALERAEYLRLVFALEADARAVATIYAWSEDAGAHPGLWDEAVMLEHYEDISATSAEAEAAQSDAGLATRAAFARWYDSDSRAGIACRPTSSTRSACCAMAPTTAAT